MRSEEGKDGSKRGDIVRGRARLLGGEVDVSTVGGDEDVVVTATGFHGQLTSEVGSRGIVAGNSTDERGAVEGGGVKVSQKDGVKERREASAREGWKGGVLEERRFCRTTSK